jgi:nucleotide-binding universal stress UspA family protein
MTASDRVERILVPTDFSVCAEGAFNLAQSLAAPLGAELVLLHVLVEAPPFSEGLFSSERVREVYAAVRRWAEAELVKWADTARAAGLKVRTDLRVGAPFREIVTTAAEEQADLLVMGTHGRSGLGRFLLGSVADRVIRLAPCPVLTVRGVE